MLLLNTEFITLNVIYFLFEIIIKIVMFYNNIFAECITIQYKQLSITIRNVTAYKIV